MPSRIGPAVKARALRLVKEPRGQYSSLAAVCQAVARQERVGVETLHRGGEVVSVDAAGRDR